MILKKILYIIILISAQMFVSCKEESQMLTVIPSEEERVRDIGQKTTKLMLKTIQDELKSTIENKGLLAALSVCNYRAISLTDSISRSMEDIINIKRTSFRFRNPENAPDGHEVRALRYFHKSLHTSGKLPDDYIEKVSKDSSTELRYYKPLVIKPLCLNCHGPSEIVASDLSYQLKRLYPQDHATGYKIDQFRGLIRVSIKEQ